MKLRQGGFLISKVHQLSGRVFARMLKDYSINEINPAQGRILFPLWQEDNISIQELAKKTALGKSTLTRMLDKLEKEGHLVRVYSDEDRRITLIRLTESNKKMKESYHQVSLEMTNLFYHGFSEDEISTFEACLEKIHRNLAAMEGNK